MVAVAGLIAHAIVSASGPEAAVELFIFKQELRSVDKSRIHLIIYRTRSEDMVDTPPLALMIDKGDQQRPFGRDGCSVRPHNG